MPDAVTFPLSLMRELTVEWNLFAGNATPGQTASGAFPSLRLDGGGLWVAKLNQILLVDDDAVRAYRALRIAARGGARALYVPRHETVQPWPLDENGRPITTYGDIPWDDEVLFDDDTGWDQPVIDCITVGSAALRATTLALRFIYGGPLRGGEVFSILHAAQGWRLYEIEAVEINDDGDSVVTFSPPLREAVADETQVEFDQPRCTMKLLSPDAMNFTLQTFPNDRPTAQFIETFFPV